MKRIGRTVLMGSCVALTFALAAVAQQMPQSKTERIKGTATVTTEELRGTVLQVEGNQLVVRMSTGDIKTFNVPDSRTAMVDGKEVTVHELKPGTRLQATITTTRTPVTERTTTVGSGKVWYVAGNTVILTLPTGENKMYKVKEDYRFIVNGEKATVHDLRKGMTVSAQKIVEEPKTELDTSRTVTGQAPPPPAPRPVVAQQPAPRPRPAPAAAAPAPAPAPAPTPAPVEQAAAPAPKLPKTGSPLPLVGLMALLFTGSSLTLRKLRRG